MSFKITKSQQKWLRTYSNIICNRSYKKRSFFDYDTRKVSFFCLRLRCNSQSALGLDSKTSNLR